MPLQPFRLNPNGRPPTRYELAIAKRPKTVHEFADHIEINNESDFAKYTLKLFYQILYPAEMAILDAHYEAWDAAVDENGFDLAERESGLTYTDVVYEDYKRIREGSIERREITLMWWA